MLRRSHKKSYGGCLECKRRHVKCDQTRPICLLCSASQRDCSYTSAPPPRDCSTSTCLTSTTQGVNESQDINIPDVPNHAASLCVPNTRPPGYTTPADHLVDPTLDARLNLNHMELLVHFYTDIDLFGLGQVTSSGTSGLITALKTSLSYPYLLHQLLAFSARHLAYLHPERSASYLHQAVTLQTRAVSLFNASWTEIDRSNCVAMLLFSAILGHHLLADTLAGRDANGLEGFTAPFAQCIDVIRGNYAICMSSWDLLMDSELKHILALSSSLTSRDPMGDNCQRASELIERSESLTEQEKQACRRAVKLLQVGLESMQGERELNRYQMIFTWTMLATPELTRLLAARQPVAVVILAYYALLMHYGRNIWQVRDAGTYVMRLIVDYLSPEWDYWIEYPRDRILGNYN